MSLNLSLIAWALILATIGSALSGFSLSLTIAHRKAIFGLLAAISGILVVFTEAGVLLFGLRQEFVFQPIGSILLCLLAYATGAWFFPWLIWKFSN